MCFKYTPIILLSFKFDFYCFNCYLFCLGLFLKLFIFFSNFILFGFFFFLQVIFLIIYLMIL
jgi:hypothetical protein